MMYILSVLSYTEFGFPAKYWSSSVRSVFYSKNAEYLEACSERDEQYSIFIESCKHIDSSLFCQNCTNVSCLLHTIFTTFESELAILREYENIRHTIELFEYYVDEDSVNVNDV